ncbi:hypothetical protein CAPTEDRAFT_214015 [Capitella teleta]|uniref:CARD domain-containing protein n=1 Tax=Capitella teleta TaxID=283909 RepID=R7THE9_CAPTE|nr:hypothetical protein CAPTEDRAFT_214015 [Capitella teleta]|eukprot:ELT93144.1 hypothetical protein CAPTEDRAFT_214015 [Capitella teleta]
MYRKNERIKKNKNDKDPKAVVHSTSELKLRRSCESEYSKETSRTRSNVEFTMKDCHKECLLKNRSFMCSEISLSAVLLAKLTESGVLTDEHLQKLQNIIRNESMKAAVLHFLVELLPKRGSKAFDSFLEALCESQQKHVAERLKKWSRDNYSEDPGTFDCLQHELRTYYEDKLKFVYTVPWLPTERFSLKDTFVQRRLRLTSGDRKGTEVEMDEILASVGKGRNKRILVEGDPGQGKSTLCQALAYAWSQPGGETENIKSFDLVILLHAGDLRGQNSVAEAIKKHLLPIDCDITSRQLEELVRTKNVLLIVDAFDEASNENEILHQMIEGKLLKHKTLLITSRPNFLQNKLSHFESTFAVEGYDKNEQLEYVKRYAGHKNIDSALFVSMLKEKSVRDLCNNPLNLTLLCLLREEDTQLMNTRTALYTSIHSIIKRKASERMNLTPAQVEESLLRPLYQIAFEAHQKNEIVVREKDFKKVENFEQVCQPPPSRSEIWVSHRSMLEFLAAKHLAQMDREERLKWMQHLRYVDYIIRVIRLAIEDHFDARQNYPVLGFLFGLLEEDAEELTQMASLVMKETHFSSKHHPLSFRSPCGASHQLMRLIGELNDVPPELEDAIIKRCPPHINIHHRCSASCRRGILKLCNLRLQPLIPLNVYLRYSRKEEKISFVKKLIKCKNIESSKICIYPHDDTQLRNIVRELRIGQADSFQQVSIYCGNIKGNPCEEFSLGENLRGLELDSFEPSLSYILEAALDKPLTSLHLIRCDELDDTCNSLLHRLLRNQHLQSVQLWSLSWEPFGRLFLTDVAQLKNLQSLEITLEDSTEEEMRIWKAILKRNKLIKLTIHSGFKYSPSLYSVLNDSFLSMSSLREIHLERVDIIDLPNLRHLDLVNFSLLYPDNRIALLSDILCSWPNLQELRIDCAFLAECSLRKLFEAIAGCHRLQILRFHWLEIGDSVVPFMCRMIESLKELREFTSEDQKDESLTEEGFKQLEPFLKRKGLDTRVF